MYKKLVLSSILFSLITLSAVSAKTTQNVQSNIQSFSVLAGDKIDFQLNYISDAKNTTGVGVKLSFDSKKLKFLGFTEKMDNSLLAADQTSRADIKNEDNDERTDAVASIAWMSVDGTWPNDSANPSLLSVAHFKVLETPDSVTRINITGNPAADSIFIAKPVSVTIGEVSNLTSVGSSSGGSFSWFLLPFFLASLLLKYLSPSVRIKK